MTFPVRLRRGEDPGARREDGVLTEEGVRGEEIEAAPETREILSPFRFGRLKHQTSFARATSSTGLITCPRGHQWTGNSKKCSPETWTGLGQIIILATILEEIRTCKSTCWEEVRVHLETE